MAEEDARQRTSPPSMLPNHGVGHSHEHVNGFERVATEVESSSLTLTQVAGFAFSSSGPFRAARMLLSASEDNSGDWLAK